jgi:hypothetical protein
MTISKIKCIINDKCFVYSVFVIPEVDSLDERHNRF